MSTRNGFRGNTRNSRKRLLKGGGAVWHPDSDPPKSFDELVGEFRPNGTDNTKGYALNAEHVADYYWNKAMTQFSKDKKGKLFIKTASPFSFMGKLVNKGNSEKKTLIKKAKDAAETEHAKKMKTNVFNMMKDFIQKYNDNCEESN